MSTQTENGHGLPARPCSTISETPLTDAEYQFKAHVSENPCIPNAHSEWMTSLCRHLERELTTEKETAKRWEATAWEHGLENIRLREVLADMVAVAESQEWQNAELSNAVNILSNDQMRDG